jgi:DNA-binding SARP family transcriptional activator
MALEFRVLGPLEVRRDAAPLPLGGTRVRALLAALLVDVGRAVSADALIDALWPEQTPRDARHALEMTVSRLRGVLGSAGPVLNRPPGYVLDVDPRTVDAVRFRQLLGEAADLGDVDPRRAILRIEEALALWRGTPYVDVTSGDFAREEIRELHELRLLAEEQRVDAALAEGRTGDIAGEIAALVAAEPARERRREQLMLGLYRAGRQADALEAFREARAYLRDELGLEPGERLRELQRAVLHQDESLTGRAAVARERPRARRPATAVVVAPSIRLDLDPEEHERLSARAAAVVERVADHYGALTADRFALVFVDEEHEATGAAAAAELAEAVPAQIGIATGDVLLGGNDVGGPLLDIARANVSFTAPTAAPGIRRADGPFVGRTEELAALRAERAAVVVGPPGIGKSRLLRELARETRVVVGRCSMYAQEAFAPIREIAAALGDADAVEASAASDIPLVVRRLCEASAPLTVCFDDVQWAYPLVIETIEHLVEHGGEQIRIVCAGRDELTDDRPSFAPRAQRIALRPLPDRDAAALARALGAEDDAIVARAEGNPLFIEQLLAHRRDARKLPPTLHSLLASRLDALPPTERAAIACAAVAGREFDAAVVAELLEQPTARAALASLVTRDLLEAAPSPEPFDERYRFRHALLHEAAYASVSTPDLARLHETVADLYAARGAADEVVGFHLERAAEQRPTRDRTARKLAEDAGERLGAAGVEAWRRGDAGTTVRLLERAVALLPPEHVLRGELLCELGTALNTIGDKADADVALAAAETAPDARISARARLERAAITAVAGATTPDELLETAAAAIRVAEAVDDPRSLGRALMLAGWARGGGLAQHADWQQLAERALLEYRRAGWRASTCIGHVAAALYLGPAPASAAADRCRRLLEDSVDDVAAEAGVTAHLAGLTAMLGDFDRAAEQLERSRSLYVELGRGPAIRRTCDPIEAAVARLEGDVERATGLLERSCAELLAAGDTFHVATQGAELADVLLDLGRPDDAEAWCVVAEKNRRPRDLDGGIRVAFVRARLTSDADAAHGAVQLADETDALNLRAKARVALADVLSRLGRVPEAADALAGARDLYARKENTAAVARLDSRSSAAAS